MSPPGRAGALLGLLAAVAFTACGAVHRLGPTAAPTAAPTPTAAATGGATVTGRVYWPDCPSGPACPSAAGVAVHFANATDRRTFTATSDRSGGYTIQLPPGVYVAIAGDADRSQYERRLAVHTGDRIQADLPISPPTGSRTPLIRRQPS